MTTQIAVKLPSTLLAAVDQLVEDAQFANRSAAVREGLKRIVDDSENASIDKAFADGFARQGESAEEMRRATVMAITAIDGEPWDKWW